MKVLDLGLARATRGDDFGADAASRLSGTPDYIAPEVAHNADGRDVRSDLYSLGCTLYYLLTGRVPFPGGTWTEKLLRHQYDAPAPLRGLAPAVPPAAGRRGRAADGQVTGRPPRHAGRRGAGAGRVARSRRRPACRPRPLGRRETSRRGRGSTAPDRDSTPLPDAGRGQRLPHPEDQPGAAVRVGLAGPGSGAVRSRRARFAVPVASPGWSCSAWPC